MRPQFLMPLLLLTLSGTAHAQSTPPAASAPQFIDIDDNALLTSATDRLERPKRQWRGSRKRIEDVALEGGQIVGVVLSVGAILGDSQRYVAVDPSSISINYTEGENKWKAILNAQIEQLRAAPEFRYEGKWKR